MTDYITPIEEQIDTILHDHCVRFMEYHSGRTEFGIHLHESPRWYNIHNFCEDTKTLTIASTKCYFINLLEEPDPNKTRCFFKIDCTDIKEYDDFIFALNSSEFWDQFRRYRTKFLIKHYPVIDSGY